MKQISQNWRQILSIQIGGAICLPVIMIGQMIGSELGLKLGFVALGIGNAFLLALSIPMAIISYKKKKPTSEITQSFFGKKTSKLFSVIFSITMLAWFSVQLNLISISIIEVITLMHLNIHVNLILLNIVLGSIMSVAAIFGIKSLKVLASLSVPILIGVLVYATISAPLPSFTMSSTSLKMASITTIIGANIVAVIDMPTYFQYAKSKKDSLIASLVLFGLALPILECVGLYLGASVPKGSLLTALIANGSAIVGIFVGFFVIFAGWTTNNMNLYSGAINSRGIFPNFSYKVRVLLIGFIATIASCFSLINHLSIILAILGVSLSAIGAVCLTSYLMNFFLKSELVKSQQTLNLIILLFSIIFGISTSFGLFTLTYLDVLDAFLIASILTIGARFIPYKSIKKERENETAI
ncbi:MAG: hypothetical protein KR126chlam6_00546 [Candidatus Anoxychlamydiales bacterium]|nr:hypothetical protein [Candidatus Anoxychlamydiales bacterium]